MKLFGGGAKAVTKHATPLLYLSCLIAAPHFQNRLVCLSIDQTKRERYVAKLMIHGVC